MNRNDENARLMRRQQAERAMQVNAAREAAKAAGKEPFDLSRFYALWRDNPDAHLAANGVTTPPEECTRIWEESYYITHPEVQSLEEFVNRLKVSQAHGSFD